MSVKINTQKRENKLSPLSALSGILPYKLYGELIGRDWESPVEEIRCRVGRPSFVTSGGVNFPLSHMADREEIEYMTDKLCGGSLYAHKETLAEGYITLSGGIRVGVCGRAALESGKIIGIYDISSLNFRLPAQRLSVGEPIVRLLREGASGVLIYSPPGVGKTTLLRSVAARMSSGEHPIRVCVVDTRGELSSGTVGSTADVLVGYPKGKGIEIATRVMNPQLIVCDEIGDEAEAAAVLSAQNCGVPLLASTHGDSLCGILCRRGLLGLHEGGVFSHYAGIERSPVRGEFLYSITERQRINDFL